MKTLLLASLTAFSFAANASSYIAKSYNEQHARGLVRTEESKKFLAKTPAVSFTVPGATVPSKYSLRSLAGPVEDQGSCGSCWDFSLTTSLRGTLITKGKDPGRLSFNYLLNCATQMAGCDGGDFDAAKVLIAPKGAPAYGSDGEYTAEAGSCADRPVAASAKDYKLIGTNLGEYPDQKSPTFQDIAYVVGVLHQPVSIDIAADDNWESYSTGVFNDCDATASLNHMVVIEGYDCESAVDSKGNCKFNSKGELPKGVGTFLIRNSWGTSWGDEGYITMKATDKTGKRCNSVATDALYFTVD